MSTTIESLELQIKSNSESAAQGIEALTLSLTKLKDATKDLGLSGVAQDTKALGDAMKKASESNQKTSKSFTDIFHVFKSIGNITKKLGSSIYSAVEKSMDYTENMNLFKVSMGEYFADVEKDGELIKGAMSTANEISAAMGIDTSDWIRAQGVFMTLATGFGVAGDRANTMSENLTQLGYDLSSFYNISVEDAMQKLQSGLSGELEPLRRLGYDLSQAKLEATAMALGIDKSVSSMTQAEKAQLRYYAIMTQVTQTHGDMARTLDDPANQMRVFKAEINMAAREIGNVFIPALTAIIPYAVAVTKIIGQLASMIAGFVGFKESGIEDTTSKVVANTDAMQENMEEAQEEAKKLKSYLLGIDEINVMSSNTDITEGISDEFDFPLPEYDFTAGLVESKINDIVEKMKEWLGLTEDIDSWADLFNTRLGKILTTVGSIGLALGAWKLAEGLISGLEFIQGLSLTGVTLTFSVIGVAAFIGDLDKLKQYVEDFATNGASFSNVSGIISEFAGLIGDALILLGKVEVGAALKVIQGVGEIVSAISNMAEKGVDVTNVTDLIRGLTNVAIAVGIFIGNLQIVGGAIAVQGFTTIIQEISENWEAIKQGDWSGVDKATLVIGAIQAIGGIVTALGVFNNIKKTTKIAEAAKGISEAATATESVSTATSTMTTKLTGLVKNLGLGIAIIAEVAAAAALFVGAIWLLGVELEQVGIAWEPVIENATTVGIAMGIGTALLVAIGVASGLLGTLGLTMCAQIGIGIAILAELGVATGLFIVEIWAIGKGLDEIGKAWKPVLDNGEDIESAITLGTGLLVAIGVVTAALGAAAVGTVGALPLAIGLGTAMLIELAIAFVTFTDSLVTVSNQLRDKLHPSLSATSEILPGLTEDMSAFTGFMGNFALETVKFSTSSAISGISATIDTIIGFFTRDPIEKMTSEVKSQRKQFEKLIKELEKTIPEMERAIELTLQYNTAMGDYANVAGSSSGAGDSSSGGFFSGIVDFFGGLFRSAPTTSGDIPAYAEGGFPEHGQLFVAREAGAEMVGNIGRRTAVANNDQIVSGIAGGVAEANEEQNVLLREQNSLLRAILEKDSGVYLDGKNLTNSVEKYQRERGRVLITGGVL